MVGELLAVVFTCVFMFFVFILTNISIDFLSKSSDCNSSYKYGKHKSCQCYIICHHIHTTLLSPAIFLPANGGR